MCVKFIADFVCTLKVVDESRLEDGLTVKIVGGSESALPCVNSVGDIIILSHVKVILCICLETICCMYMTGSVLAL